MPNARKWDDFELEVVKRLYEQGNDNLLHYLPHTYKSENSAMAGLADFKKAGNSRMRNLVWQGDDPKKLIDGGE